jgi:hypothetical protein
MPRDGSNVYHRPTGTDAIPNNTIESAKYNANVVDVETDLNTPRPIVAGGTGASDAHTAMVNLSGEIAGQVVTNYDSFAFADGSFYSAPGATSAPDASNYFAGICYGTVMGAPTLEVQAVSDGLTPHATYTRSKGGGSWNAWKKQAGSVTDLDAAYVNVTGDTMSGSLTLSGTAGLAAGGVVITGNAGTAGTYYFGNSGTKYLNCDGTNFVITGPFFATGLYSDGGITAGRSGTTGTYSFGNTGTKSLSYDGTNFNLTGGTLSVGGDVNASHFGSAVIGSPTTGTYYFGNTGTKYLNYDGTNFNLNGGPLICSGTISATGHTCRSGVSGTYRSNVFNIDWTTAAYLSIDNTSLGQIAFVSDYRIKKDVIDLDSMWDTVKGLRPIKYTQAQFSPPSHVKYVAEQALQARKEAEENPDAKPREVSTAPLFAADDIERWGFIAHELQATLTPSAASGEKDSPDTIQSPNPFTLIAALTKALQEAMARIEALEAA